MARKATGSIRKAANGFEVRVTLEGNKRLPLRLGPRDEEGARQRGALVASYAARLRTAGLLGDPTAQVVLRDLAARNGGAFELAQRLAAELLGGESRLPGTPEAKPTFRQVADDWTGGELHKRYPDHVKQKKDRATDKLRLAHVCGVDFGGIAIGDVAIDAFTIEHAEHVMRSLPEAASRPATRRHYAQIVHRVLALAVYPLRLIQSNPLPKGFMPRIGGSPLFPYLYPSEEAALLACQRVDLELRMAHGFAVREGLRLGELEALNVRDFALAKDGSRGTVTLDENKTDDPRSWALRPDTARALVAWFKARGAKGAEPAFPEVNGGRFTAPGLATRIRAALAEAGVARRALHTGGTNTRPYRWHDARGSFITIASANGRSEAWIADRTGHTTSAMINRYRKRAREAGELGLGDWADLDESVPELSAVRSIPPRFRPSDSSGRVPEVAQPLDIVTVSRDRIELSTRGFSVHCSTN